MNWRTLRAALVISVALSAASLRALDLPPQFSDNMVLQRGALNRIWGHRTPDLETNVCVEFQGNGGEPALRMDTSRKSPTWSIEFTASDLKLKNRGPATLTIWEGNKKGAAGPKVILKNVLIGDVWILAVPNRQGFAYKPPQNLGETRALWVPTAAALDSPAPSNQATWGELTDFDTFPALAHQVALAMRSADSSVPLGLIVTTTADWPASLQLAFSDSYAHDKVSSNVLKNISHAATSVVKKQKQNDELMLIAFKHAGKVTNSVEILPYADLEPYDRKKYPDALKSIEWNYRGALFPTAKK